MPSFQEFEYYFAIDVLEIPASWISLQVVWASILMIILPSILVLHLKDTEYRNLFLTVQGLWCFSYFGKLALAEGWSQATGLPNFLVYFLSG